MNETESRRLVVRLTQEVADRPAPLGALLSNAHRARRRQRQSRLLATLGGAAAAAVGVAALSSGSTTQARDNTTQPAAPASSAAGDEATNGTKAATPDPCNDGLKYAPTFPEPIAKKPPFPTNANGQTYGSDTNANSLRDSPDLVAVAGDCGAAGYVKATDLNGPQPTSPADALRIQKEQQASPPVLPVYLSDGTTQVDTFTLATSVGVGTP